MRIGNDVRLEIMSIIQDAIIQGVDASQGLRELDLEIGVEELVLSKSYLRTHPRMTEWPNEPKVPAES